MSESELIKAFRENRSEEAFAQLVRLYAGLVYSVAKRRLGNGALAEDVTQIVFIQFAKTPPNVANPAELAAWLHRTTLNITINTWRSESRRRARELQAVVMESSTPETDRWEDLSPKLDEALNQLSDEDRQTVLLRFFGQKSMRELGVALGVTEDAAKMRVSRAVHRLRALVGVSTAEVLCALLWERSVEAAPAPLVARLAAIKLPAAATAVGVGGFLAALMRVSKLNLVTGAVVLGTVAVGIGYFVRAVNTTPGAESTLENPAANLASESVKNKRLQPTTSPAITSELSSAKTIMSFHVLDAETGEPLASAKIRAAHFGVGGMGERHEYFTDHNGNLAILEPEDPTKNTMNVFVVAEGHVPKCVRFGGIEMPADYTMKLDRATTASGRVVDEQGQPVAGVDIWVQTPGNIQGQRENIDFQTCPVTSREDGSWSFTCIPRDFTKVGFILKKTGYAATFPNVPVASVNLTNLILIINRGFTITGRIVDEQERPVANGVVNIVSGDPDKRQSTKSDEKGVFTLTGVFGEAGKNGRTIEPSPETNDNGAVIIRGPTVRGRGQIDLALQADRFASQSSRLELTESTNVINFTLSPGNIFRGRIIDEIGNPIKGAVVRTDFDFKNQVECPYSWNTVTDENGRFEWDEAPGESICYWFEAAGYENIRGSRLLADDNDHEIILKRAR